MAFSRNRRPQPDVTPPWHDERMGNVLVLTRDIAAPPETVWRVLSDIDASARRVRGIDRVVRVAGPDGRVVGGYEVGTSWRATRRTFGSAGTETMTVTAVDPGRSSTVEGERGGTRAVTTFRLEPAAGGTTLTVERSRRQPRQLGMPRSVMLDIAGAFGMRATRKALRAELDELARAAEAEYRAS